MIGREVELPFWVQAVLAFIVFIVLPILGELLALLI